jgi:hypothetical protein
LFKKTNYRRSFVFLALTGACFVSESDDLSSDSEFSSLVDSSTGHKIDFFL